MAFHPFILFIIIIHAFAGRSCQEKKNSFNIVFSAVKFSCDITQSNTQFQSNAKKKLNFLYQFFTIHINIKIFLYNFSLN